MSEWLERCTDSGQFLGRLVIVDLIDVNLIGGGDLNSVSHNTVGSVELNIDGFEMYWLIGCSLVSS